MADLELRPLQVAVMDRLRESFKAGHRAVMCYAPTGFGKSECAIHLMNATEKNGKRSAMILDRIILCNQTSERLQKYGIDHGVLQSGHWRYRPDKKIQICSAQTLEKRGSFPGLDLMIIDEAHAQRSQTIEFIKQNPQLRVIGLSASPFTKGLGQTYSDVVSSTTTGELVREGWLAGLRVFVAKEIDMAGAKKIAGEWSPKETTQRGIQITGDVVSEWVKKTHEIFGGPKKTIVFCSGVAHGADLSQRFAQAGYNFISISYEDDDEFKRQAIEDFSRPDTDIHGLIATDILTKGFDVPDVMIGISARPFSKSFSSHVQQMGRVMRAYPGKEFAVWIDHSGNYLRFQDQWDELYNNGVSSLDDGAEKTKPEPTEKEKERAKCPQCGAFWPTAADSCPHCGYIHVKRNAVQEVCGEVIEIGSKQKSEKYDSAYKEHFYQQLLGWARLKGYADGWAYHAYKEKFAGVNPAWKKVAAVVGDDVYGWITHRAIKNAKKRAA